MTFIHSSVDLEKTAKIGSGTRIWNYSQIRENATIGNNCVIGRDVYIDHDVIIGDNCKIQNQALIYYKTEIESNVFIGPQVCFTNDKNPRATSPQGKPRENGEWKAGHTIVRMGASIGAGSIILPDIVIGKWAMVGAGSIVTKDVPDYTLVFGNPAKSAGYVCPCGGQLSKKSGIEFICSDCRQAIKI